MTIRRAQERRAVETTALTLDLAGEAGEARPSGALWLPRRRALIVSDLHLGKSERLARTNGVLLPPYEGLETLLRLGAEIDALAPKLVVSLGDAFDDVGAARAPDPRLAEALRRLMAGRRWIWALGNHDPVAPGFGGDARAEIALGALALRHEACAAPPQSGQIEISGHFHPKARLFVRGRRLVRRCFLWDGSRLILPAFGAYTGGLCVADPVFDRLLSPSAQALFISGDRVLAVGRANCV